MDPGGQGRIWLRFSLQVPQSVDHSPLLCTFPPSLGPPKGRGMVRGHTFGHHVPWPGPQELGSALQRSHGMWGGSWTPVWTRRPQSAGLQDEATWLLSQVPSPGHIYPS